MTFFETENNNTPIVSLDIINQTSPYKVTYYKEREEILYFSTSKGLEYVITFVLDKTLDIPNMYQLVIEELFQTHASYAPLIEKTIVSVIHAFFTDKMNVLAYVCDTSDKHEKARNYLFNKWFMRHNGNRYYKYDGIVNAMDNIYYSSIICSREHNNVLSIKTTFYNFVAELQK